MKIEIRSPSCEVSDCIHNNKDECSLDKIELSTIPHPVKDVSSKIYCGMLRVNTNKRIEAVLEASMVYKETRRGNNGNG